VLCLPNVLRFTTGHPAEWERWAIVCPARTARKLNGMLQLAIESGTPCAGNAQRPRIAQSAPREPDVAVEARENACLAQNQSTLKRLSDVDPAPNLGCALVTSICQAVDQVLLKEGVLHAPYVQAAVSPPPPALQQPMLFVPTVPQSRPFVQRVSTEAVAVQRAAGSASLHLFKPRSMLSWE